MKAKIFYMIYVEGENAPTYKHETWESAAEEAKRLADVTGKKVYILQSVCSVERNLYNVEYLLPFKKEQELPF